MLLVEWDAIFAPKNFMRQHFFAKFYYEMHGLQKNMDESNRLSRGEKEPWWSGTFQATSNWQECLLLAAETTRDLISHFCQNDVFWPFRPRLLHLLSELAHITLQTLIKSSKLRDTSGLGRWAAFHPLVSWWVFFNNWFFSHICVEKTKFHADFSSCSCW
jgi:hypothetical protein